MTDAERPHRGSPRKVAAQQLLLTTEEAAELLRVGRTTVYALIKEGKLRPIHIGRSCRLSRAELEGYVRRLDAGPGLASGRMSLPTRRRQQTAGSQSGLFDLDPPSPDAA